MNHPGSQHHCRRVQRPTVANTAIVSRFQATPATSKSIRATTYQRRYLRDSPPAVQSTQHQPLHQIQTPPCQQQTPTMRQHQAQPQYRGFYSAYTRATLANQTVYFSHLPPSRPPRRPDATQGSNGKPSRGSLSDAVMELGPPRSQLLRYQRRNGRPSGLQAGQQVIR